MVSIACVASVLCTTVPAVAVDRTVLCEEYTNKW
jgi:hypothetical protein